MTGPDDIAPLQAGTARGPVRVYLVDDHRLFLSGVRSELRGHVELVGEATDVASAVEGITATRAPRSSSSMSTCPTAAAWPSSSGVLADAPEVRFLALSVSDAAEDVIGVIRAGARGYVTKTISGPKLVEAIAGSRDGDAVFSPRLAGFVLDAFAATHRRRPTIPSSTSSPSASARSCGSSPGATRTRRSPGSCRSP